MSRPIYEPSLPRADAENAYGNRQLFRRPAPISEDPLAWMAVWDNGINGILFDSSAGEQKFYWEEGKQSDNSLDIFELEDGGYNPTVGFNITIPKLLVDGVYTFSFQVHWSGASQSNVSNVYRLGPDTGNDFQYPGQVSTNRLETRRVRILTNFNDKEWMDDINWTLPVHLDPITGPPVEVEFFTLVDSRFSAQDWTDVFYSQMWVTYHGPVNTAVFTDWT